MMRVLIDTNIILDVLLNRVPWVTASQLVWQAHDDNKIAGYLSATIITDVFYITRRAAGLNIARASVRACLNTFTICTVDRLALNQADSLPGSDFEDNVQIACATIARLDAIVTRDTDGFKQTALAVFSPAELVAQLP